MTYLISDQVPESDLNKVTGKVAGFISELGGTVGKEDIWGRRKLAYQIRKNDFATYVTLYFSLSADKVKEFDRELILANEILRHLLIVQDLGTEDMSLTAEEIADTAEIEEVIGGEKSFEAVEGETEESRDLMAKREEIAEEKPAEKVEAEEAPKEITEEETEPEKPVEEEKKVEKAEKKVEPKKEEKPEKIEKPKAKKKDSSDEAERLSKLNEELDDILKDEL